MVGGFFFFYMCSDSDKIMTNSVVDITAEDFFVSNGSKKDEARIVPLGIRASARSSGRVGVELTRRLNETSPRPPGGDLRGRSGLQEGSRGPGFRNVSTATENGTGMVCSVAVINGSIVLSKYTHQ